MKIQPFSDLHLDVSPPPPITIGDDVDVVIVAGDTCEGARNAFTALRNIVPETVPIVKVMGNHEFYRRIMRDELALAQELAPMNYRIGQTRVLCNPHGYWDENPSFNGALVVEIPS